MYFIDGQQSITDLEEGGTVVVHVLYTLKSADKSFHKDLTKRIHGLGFNPSLDDTYTLMNPVVKPFCYKYYVCVTIWVDDSMTTRDNPEK